MTDQTCEHSSGIKKYLTWSNAGIFLAGYALVFLVLSYALPFYHGKLEKAGQFGDMFGVVNAFASGLAMIGVGLAVWLQRQQVIMQDHELKGTMLESQQQTAALNAQLQIARSQADLEGKAYIERNKPIVFTDRVATSDGSGYDYVMRNVGGGFAINVYFIAEDAVLSVPRLSGVRALGSLAPNTERPFPQTLGRALCDSENHPIPHILLAEGPYSRTTQWTATLNYRTAFYDPMEGHVRHRVAAASIPPPRFKGQSLRDFLNNNLQDIQRQLHDFVTLPEDLIGGDDAA